MLPRFHLTDLSTLAHYVGTLVLMAGGLMLVPLAVAVLFSEHAQVAAFSFGCGVALLSGALLRLFPSSGLDRRRALLLTGFAWVFVALVCTLPLYLSGDFASFLDALFDAVSFITTTGATLAEDVDSLARSQIVWRACMTLAGAQAIVAVTLLFGLSFSIDDEDDAAVNERGVRAWTRSDARALARDMAFVTGAVVAAGTFAAGLLLVHAGFSVRDAAVEGFSLAANAFGTSAFVPHASNLVYYHSLGLDALAALLMLLGSLNFLVFVCCMRRRVRMAARNAELRSYAVWICIVAVFVSFSLAREGIFTDAAGLACQGTFMAISVATTGGMQTVYPEQFGGTISDGAVVLLVAAAFVGGCTASAAGGMKVFRSAQIARWFRYSVLRQLVPDSAWLTVRYEHFGTRRLVPRAASAAMTIAILFIVFAALGSMFFIAHGNDAVLAVFESVGFLCNVGVDVGLTSPSMPLAGKVVAMLLMWAGRLEFVALLAAIAGIVVSFRPMRSTRALGPHGASARKKARRPLAFSSVAPVAAVSAAAASALLSACLLLQAVPVPSASAADGADASAAAASAVAAVQTPGEERDGVFYREEDIAGLLAASYRLDGKAVTFTGDAVGTPIRADEGHVWVNLKAGGRMVGVYLDDGQASQIAHFASYVAAGDSVTVSGDFKRVCGDHANELEVHADTVAVGQQGGVVEHAVNPAKLLGGLALAALAVAVLLARRVCAGRSFARRRPRRSGRARGRRGEGGRKDGSGRERGRSGRDGRETGNGHARATIRARRGEGADMAKKKSRERKNHPVFGLLTVLASAIAFLAFLAFLTAVVWLIV